MEAFAQHQQRYPMHMEIIAAAGTSAERNQKCEINQKDNPDHKYGSHGSVAGKDGMGNPQGGNIHQYGKEKIHAAAARLFHDLPVLHRINCIVSHAHLHRPSRACMDIPNTGAIINR